MPWQRSSSWCWIKVSSNTSVPCATGFSLQECGVSKVSKDSAGRKSEMIHSNIWRTNNNWRLLFSFWLIKLFSVRLQVIFKSSIVYISGHFVCLLADSHHHPIRWTWATNSVSDLWPFLDRFIRQNLQLGDCWRNTTNMATRDL
jgi:hypothetical protein